MRGSRCCREAPASWDKLAKPCDSSHENQVWSRVVLSAGCPVRPPPGAQEAAAQVLPSARDPHLAQLGLVQLGLAQLIPAWLSSAPTTAEDMAMLSCSIPFCPV